MLSIDVNNLSYSYPHGKTKVSALENLGLQCNAGEFMVLTGPSGAGKSTFLTLLAGLRSVQEGSLKVFDQELKDMNQRQMQRFRRSLGFVFQNHNLIDSLTAYESLRLTMKLFQYERKEQKERPYRVLKDLGLEGREHHLPRELSQGQCQRVAVGRALINQPKLILADEPTASLDRANGDHVIDILMKQAREHSVTVIVVTHDPSIFEKADRVVTIVDGVVKES